MNHVSDPRLGAVADAHPYPLLFATVSGAHLYGFASADSDVDLRGVHVLPWREVVGLEVGPDTIERMGDESGLDLDLVTHDAAKFFRLMLRPNGYVLEQLFSPLVVRASATLEELLEREAQTTNLPEQPSARRGLHALLVELRRDAARR